MPEKYFSAKLIKLILISVVCFFLIFLNPKGFFNPVRNILIRLGYPFQKTSYILSGNLMETFAFFGSISELKKENEKLIKENLNLSAQMAELADQKKENENFRKQLELIPRDKYEIESAFVISIDSHNSGSWILIDKGANKGIVSGMPVIVSDGILVGKISEVYGESAKVSLITDIASSINVTDLETEARGIVKGEYNLGLILDMVEQTDVLNEGDSLVTSGLGGSLPKGLLVGHIQKINATQDKLFQQAVVIPKVKYSRLDIVHVLKN